MVSRYSDWVFGTQSTLGAALTGLDPEPPVVKVYGDNLLTAVADGLVDEALVDEAVSRMVRKKLEYNLGQPREPQGVLGSDAHLALAREAATKGSVLKNASASSPLAANALDTHWPTPADTVDSGTELTGLRGNPVAGDRGVFG